MFDVLAVTGPIYFVVAVGYACTRAGLFERADMRVFGKFVIHIALPALLFNAVAQRSVAEVLNPVFIAAYAMGSVAASLAGVFWARRIAGKPRRNWPRPSLRSSRSPWCSGWRRTHSPEAQGPTSAPFW